MYSITNVIKIFPEELTEKSLEFLHEFNVIHFILNTLIYYMLNDAEPHNTCSHYTLTHISHVRMLRLL